MTTKRKTLLKRQRDAVRLIYLVLFSTKPEAKRQEQLAVLAMAFGAFFKESDPRFNVSVFFEALNFKPGL